MQKVGIDSLAFYTSRYALDLSELAKERSMDPDKFYSSLGQYKMSVSPPDEDIVTMAANAGFSAIRDNDVSNVELLLFATESGIDQSKAAGIYVHHLLNLPEQCRVVELKQACYSGTCGLQLALPFLRENPDKKVLLIASDIARYGFGSGGESSQGAGAVAMLLTADPRIIAFENEYGIVTENVMDFWRPNYRETALVEGKYSSKLYLQMLEKAWRHYQTKSTRDFFDHRFYCYHTPVPRLVEKAHQHLAKICGIEKASDELLEAEVSKSLEYSRYIGNTYAASLYIGLASLLDLVDEDLSNERLGFYSYGSGCVAEYFSGIIQPGYKKSLNTKEHQHLLKDRIPLTHADYVKFYSYTYPQDGSMHDIPQHRTGQFRLSAIRDHKRIYEKCLPLL